MESFDMFLNGNFVALKPFQRKYGVELHPGVYSIPTRWQSALFQSGQCGAFVGVFLAGPITTKLGYRWTTILALIMMNATIFISFFVSHQNPPNTQGENDNSDRNSYRPNHLLSSPSVKHLKVSHGVSSSPTRLPTPPRSFHLSFVVPQPLPCRCPGPSVVSSWLPPHTATRPATTSGPGESLLPCNGFSQYVAFV